VSMPVSTWVEVDLDRLASNLRAIRTLVGEGHEIMLVVKADAYGHGAVEIAEAAAREGVTHLGVATLHEGIQLRRAGCLLPIIALSPLLPSEIHEAVAHDLSPSVADIGFAEALSRAAVAARRAVRCHVEIDTGMGRTGVHLAEAEAFIERLGALEGLRLASVYTHFPDADADDLAFAHGQVERFTQLVGRLRARGLTPPRVHAANSAGTINVPEATFDWVRVGLIAYGHQPPHAGRQLVLAPVMSLKSRLVQIRDMPAGASVSYGRTYVADHAIRMGVVAVGYGHGYSWLLSNRGRMLVGGRSVPILGRVTMDLTMVDLSEVPDAAVGDEVVLFGEQGEASLPLEEVARGSETLPYEIMCTIGKRVARIFVRGGRPVKLTTLVGESAEWAEQAADHFRMRARALNAARKSGSGG
jgi:alanine racemase